MPKPHERYYRERPEPPEMPPRPPERELPPRPGEEITHEDLAELIEAKFERVFRELEEVKRRLR